jgi:long-subunit acyl-CoA synthetase (AMP-forming)
MKMYSQGAASFAIDPDTWLEGVARQHPDRIFLKTAAGRVLTYRSAREDLARFASALRRDGIGHGDRVAVRIDSRRRSALSRLSSHWGGVRSHQCGELDERGRVRLR